MKHNVWNLILCNKVIFGPNVDKTPLEGDASINVPPSYPTYVLAEIELRRFGGGDGYALVG